MNRFRAVLTVVLGLTKLWLVGSASALPDLVTPPADEPSFDWARQRFGRLPLEQLNGDTEEQNAIVEWTARPDIRDMRVLVSDVWSQLSYISRYRLVQGLGTIAARKGYTVTVVDRDNRILATYTCTLDGARLVECQADLNPIPPL